MTSLDNIRWEQLLRYRLIETIAMWEGQLSTQHLINAFGIGRQQASKDINFYNHEIAPDNLTYDSALKRYIPSENFLPVLTSGTADEYLGLMANKSQGGSIFETLPLSDQTAEILQLPLRSISPEILRPLIQACKTGARLDVDYVSLHSPDREGRVIVPHSLVYTGMRWHVRAWCEKNQAYRDFVLSRFRGEASLMGESDNGIDGDEKWNTMVDIVITPDVRLSDLQKEVVERDYGMQDGKLVITVRGSLVHYVLQLLHIDTTVILQKPEAQQIMIHNLHEISPFLFN